MTNEHDEAPDRAPVRVAWFVSNHGWGHLSRSTVIAEAFLRHGHAVLMVVAPELEQAVRAALPGGAIEVVTGDLDRGYAFGAGGRGADAERSRELIRYGTSVDPAVLEAVQAWAPDVLASDATPWASRVAGALSVPSVICSNFSWDDQYASLFEGHADVAAEVEIVREHVAAFTLALELPLGPGIPATPKRRAVPLVSRWPSDAPVSDVLPVGKGELITWAFGRTPLAEQPLEGLQRLVELAKARGLRVGATAATAEAVPGVVAIPDDGYWPDVLAASRLVVSKAGYSTLAEALRGRTHLIVFGITGLPEERGMVRAVEAVGYGLAIPLESSDPASGVEAHANALLDRPRRDAVTENGTAAIVDEVVRLVR